MLRQIWAALPQSWFPALRSPTLGPSDHCVHRFMNVLDFSILLQVAGTLDDRTLSRA